METRRNGAYVSMHACFSLNRMTIDESSSLQLLVKANHLRPAHSHRRGPNLGNSATGDTLGRYCVFAMRIGVSGLWIHLLHPHVWAQIDVNSTTLLVRGEG